MASNKYLGCIVEGCQTKYGMKKRLFQFPGPQFRCNQWISSLKREDLKGTEYRVLQRRGLKVCEDHFRPEAVMNITSKHRLVHDANPDLTVSTCISAESRGFHSTVTSMEPQTGCEEMDVSTESLHQVSSTVSSPSRIQHNITQTAPTRARKNWSPAKKKLFAKLQKSRRSIKSLKRTVLRYRKELLNFRWYSPEMLDDILKDHISPSLRSFIVSQVKSDKTNPKGRRYSIRDKSFALSLFHKSPSCYNVLRHLLHMPGRTTLYKFVDGIVHQAGLHSELLGRPPLVIVGRGRVFLSSRYLSAWALECFI